MPALSTEANESDTSGAQRRKHRGAFYTPDVMARRMVEWAIRDRAHTVMDPGAGDLVFLEAGLRRLVELGASEAEAKAQLCGAEIDDTAHDAATTALQLDRHRVLRGDFFELQPRVDLPLVTAVVGNPPYIRYQGFNPRSDRAHALVADAGLSLGRLASSWAPFLIHAISFVENGGRMAQVLPAELLHAQYANSVLGHLRGTFETVVLVTFEERVFPGALEEVVILLADGRGGEATQIGHLQCQNLSDFDPAAANSEASSPTRVNRKGRGRREKLLFELLNRRAQLAYAGLADDPRVKAFGEWVKVDIGVVTGANRFFLRSESEAAGVPQDLLRPALSKAAQMPGARIRAQDVAQLRERGAKYLLFAADATADVESAAVQKLLRQGIADRVPNAYKCRIRSPWWAVPRARQAPPPLLMTYCANHAPRISVNDERVLSTNTLHNVRPKDGAPAAARIAVGFFNSLTLLSAELVGRSYGGGVLKLEPTEAEALLLPPLPVGLERYLAEVDELLRSGRLTPVLDLVDPLVFGPLGVSADVQTQLRAGWERLRSRRAGRGQPPR